MYPNRKRTIEGTFMITRGPDWKINKKWPYEPLVDPQYDQTISAVRALAEPAGDRSPAIGLKAVAELRYQVDTLEFFSVLNARNLGWSWQNIAQQLGVSKQTIHARYTQQSRPPCRHQRPRRPRRG